MPGKVAKIGTFSDWIGLFNDWRKDIGVNTADIDAFHFDTLYGAIDTEEIEFGSYKGRRKWENLRQIPTQQMRDALMNMIVYQGDTEFASVEQQRNLLENAPTEWDRRAITRVMIEEMRHGWQMCALLVDHFGYSGKVEAQKMLERRAFENKRLLGAFNVDVDNWMDFFTYTDFVDRDGKFQLQMLKYSAFAPLGRSMSYMLREEAFHMGTGNDGLRRIVEAGVIPAWLIQKYLNKWISSSYDLFGTDHSSSAHWAYVWGVKGRYDEPKNDKAPDLDDLNDYNRNLYRDEVAGLIERFNSALRAGRAEAVRAAHQVQSRHRKMGGTEIPRADRRTARRSRLRRTPERLHAVGGRQEAAARHHQQREEMDCREDRRARSALDHRGSAEVGDQPVRRPMTAHGYAERQTSQPTCSAGSIRRLRSRGSRCGNPPLNVIDIPMMEELSASSGGDRSAAGCFGDRFERRRQGVFGWRGCGRAHSRQSRGDAGEVPRRDPRAGRDEESHDRRGARALSGRWRGIGHGLRHGLHDGIGAVGISRDQAGLLSAGGMYRAGCARRTEARGRADSDRADDQRERGGGDGSGQSCRARERIGVPPSTNVSGICASSARRLWPWPRKHLTPGTRCTSIKAWPAPSGFISTN